MTTVIPVRVSLSICRMRKLRTKRFPFNFTARSFEGFFSFRIRESAVWDRRLLITMTFTVTEVTGGMITA